MFEFPTSTASSMVARGYRAGAVRRRGRFPGRAPYPLEEGDTLAMRITTALGTCALLLAACGGSTTTLGSGGGGTASVSGTAGGQQIPTSDQVGVTGTETTSGVLVAYAGAVISNVPDTC